MERACRIMRFNLAARWLPGDLLQAAHQGDAGKVREISASES